MITLVSGYSKSGKTTLPKLFNGNLPWNYAVYSKNKTLNVREMRPIAISRTVLAEFCNSFEKKEFSYDDLEKGEDFEDQEVENYFEDYEDIKDDKNKFLGNSLRDMMDYIVLEQRKKDPSHFIRRCFEKSINGNEAFNLMITDFRFPEDESFLKGKKLETQTIRIYREETEPKSLDKELDFMETDFLLLPLENHELVFPKFVRQFPRYKEYTLSEPKIYV